MNPSEWLEIAATIKERWPHAQLPDESIARWGDDVADLDADHVAAAIESLYREGREFAPNGGQIRHRLNDLLLDAPEWSEALRQLRCAERTPIERAVVDHDAYEAGAEPTDAISFVYPRGQVLRETHPLVLSFRDHIGEEDLGRLAGLTDGADEARARQKWATFVSRAHEILNLQGIPDAGLRKLRRVQGPGELRKLGFVDHAGELEPAEDAA